MLTSSERLMDIPTRTMRSHNLASFSNSRAPSRLWASLMNTPLRDTMYRMHKLPCYLLAILCLCSACAQGGYNDASKDMPKDMASPKDMGVTPDITSLDMPIDHAKDMPTPQPTRLTPTQSPSSGGGTLVTTSHRVRLLIGAPQPVQEITTSRHQIKLGAGSSQHGQATTR